MVTNNYDPTSFGMMDKLPWKSELTYSAVILTSG